MPPTDLELLTLVFTRHMLVEMLHADDKVDISEAELLIKLVPHSRLKEAGLLDGTGMPTEAWLAVRDEAIRELPLRLALDEKLKILTNLVKMAVVDDDLHRDEGSLLYASAEVLGVTPRQFDRHLDTLTEHVGTVEIEE